MQSQKTFETSAFVGIAFSNDVIYNYVEDDGEFEFTGLSLIAQLKYNRNEIIADIIKSQSYDRIRAIMDDEVIFGTRGDRNNSNVAYLNELYHMMEMEDQVFDYYYILDFNQDLLIVKTPDLIKPIALEYQNNDDVEYFLNINN
jgi:hypothetical protein